MADIPFVADRTGEIERKFLVTYIDISDPGALTPQWEAVGVKVESSAIELNADISTITDILGITTTTVNTVAPNQSFAPNTARYGSKLHEKLWNDYMVKKDLAAAAEYKVMIVYGFAGEVGAYTAEVQTGCTVEVTSFGGSGRMDIPFNIHYSNKSEWGTANYDTFNNSIVFTQV